MSSRKARKRVNRMMRMIGRVCASDTNARQHVASHTYARDEAKGGMAELERWAADEIERMKRSDAEAAAFRRLYLGNFDDQPHT